ncbi:MAG: type II secretion system protein [Phycisphaerales bacterium]
MTQLDAHAIESTPPLDRPELDAPATIGRASQPERQGFTLIEILIVVVILGILAAITVPQFASASVDASRATYVNNLRAFVDSAYRYQFDNAGTPLPDSASGVLPVGFDAYVMQVQWEGGTPVGGVWDIEQVSDSGETYAAVGVHFDGTGETRDDDFMTLIDAAIDDGDLTTGAHVKLADGRYYFIID